MAVTSRAALWFEFSRPFTLVAPALGFASGAVTAAGAFPREAWHTDLVVYPLIGLTMAAVLNAASNALNQIYDLEIDRVNKPARPLPSGPLTTVEAAWFTAIAYAMGPGAGVAGQGPRSPRMLLGGRSCCDLYGAVRVLPDAPSATDARVDHNHVSWADMYRMMFVARIGFALAYLL